MKVLFVGGTGNISSAVSRACVERGDDLYLLNRGARNVRIDGATALYADVTRPDTVRSALAGSRWDAVVDWIAFTEPDIERDLEIFRGSTGQYVFISSASAYEKPPRGPVITEATPLANPFWEYSRHKIACETRLLRAYRDEGFPVTIVRPSHTYDTVIPIPVFGWNDYTIIARMRQGRRIVVHGDGTSLWTLTHAEDFARGFVGLLGNPQAIGEAYHITADELLTWNQIYREIAAAAGCEARVVHVPSEFIAACDPAARGTLLGDKAHSVIFDNAKIRRAVPGFRATIPFSAGIRRTLAWFEADASRHAVRRETDDRIDAILAAYGHDPADQTGGAAQ